VQDDAVPIEGVGETAELGQGISHLTPGAGANAVTAVEVQLGPLAVPA
jgi:hypothetical protein